MEKQSQLAYDMFRFLCRIKECDIEDLAKQERGVRAGTIGSLNNENRLFEIYRHYIAREYGVAIEKGKAMLEDVLEKDFILAFDYQGLKGDVSLLKEMVVLAKRYEHWKEYARKDLYGIIRNLPLVKVEELTEEVMDSITYATLNDARLGLNFDDYIKVYRYAGDGLLPLDSSYGIRENIVATTDPSRRLVALTKSEQESGIAEVSIILHIEDVLDYSHFIICVKYGDNVWIATDRLEFSNPRCARSSRNPAVRRERWWEKVSLPYSLIDDVDRLRRETAAVAKENVGETWVFDTCEKFNVGGKICISIFIQEILQKIAEMADIPRIGVAGYFGAMILAEKSGGGQHEDLAFLRRNYEECKRVYVDDLVLPESNSLAPLDMGVEVAKRVKPGELVTMSQMQDLVQWARAEAKREQRQEILDRYHKEHWQEERDQVGRIFKERMPRIFEYLFAGREETYLYIVDEGAVSTFAYGSGDKVDRIFTTDDVDRYNYKEIYGGDYLTCAHCNESRTKGLKNMVFCASHWAHLTAILGVSRRALPFCYRNYRGEYWRPYYGNQILDNVNPEFLVMDRLSKERPGALTFGIHLCQKCRNALIKRYGLFDKALILYSKEANTILDVVDYDVYVRQHPELKTLKVDYV